jgi:hypothetical protein
MKKRLRRKLWKGEFADIDAHRPGSSATKSQFDAWVSRKLREAKRSRTITDLPGGGQAITDSISLEISFKPLPADSPFNDPDKIWTFKREGYPDSQARFRNNQWESIT